MSRKALIVAGVIVLLAAAGGAAWYVMDDSDDSGPSAAQAATPATGKGAITPHDMTMGNPRAKVTLIEYAAPRCPHCAHFNEAAFPQIKRDYIDTGKVFYVFRVLPLAQGDGVAEKLARCLPKEKYFPFMDQLFRNQAQWDDEYGITDVRGGLLAQAQKQGMTEAQFDACVAGTKEDAIINQVAQDGVDRYGINSTPSIVINGKLAQNAHEYSEIKPLLDAALAGK